MTIKLNEPISESLQSIVAKNLTSDTINRIGRANGFQNGYATKLFAGVINESERNHELIINVCRKAFQNVR